MRIYPLTEAKRERWIAEGRGTGEGAAYLSWLRYEDCASHGDKHRLTEGDTGRLCALFSSVEYRLFLYLDAAIAVEQLYEGYPLDLERTRQIAMDLGIQHPRDRHSGVDLTMTTDLRAQVRTESGLVWIPFQCKYSKNLGDFNTAEHTEIERRYWLERNETLRLVTEDPRCISDTVFANLEAMFPHRFLHNELLPSGLTLEERNALFLRSLLGDVTHESVIDFCHRLAARYGLQPNDWTSQFFYMAYRRLIAVDLTKGDLRQQDIVDIAVATRRMVETALEAQ